MEDLTNLYPVGWNYKGFEKKQSNQQAVNLQVLLIKR